MANRKIVIVDSAASKKIILSGDFTTFGDVLNVARENGVNTTNKDFMEGITKTIFNRADALLPTDVPYKGRTTNDLVFSITTSNKHIESGASRQELKELIIENNLGGAIKEMLGKNWTNCSNAELEQAVRQLCNTNSSSVGEGCDAPCEFVEEYDNFVVGIARLLASLNPSTLEDILECVEELEDTEGTRHVSFTKKNNVPEIESPFSDEELTDILNNID